MSPPKITLLCLSLLAVLCGRAETGTDLFDDSVIHNIHLRVDPNDWETLRAKYLEDTYYRAHFTWKEISQEIGIRSRGRGSRSPIKPNLTLNFAKYDKKQTFQEQTAVYLKANNQDASAMREWIAFQLFERMGLPAPREAPARLYINGDYFGFYMIVEREDEQFLQRSFGENGGYLYEWDPADVYNFENLGADPKAYRKFLKLQSNQHEPDWANFIAMIQAINTTSDAEFISGISKYLDPKLYLTHVAIENVLAEGDGMVGGIFGMNNFDLYRFAGQTVYQFLAWDKDLSFTAAEWDILHGTQKNVLARRLLVFPEYREYYYSTLVKAASILGGVGGWADGEITRLYDLMGPIATNDPNKQCSNNGVLFPCGPIEFETEVKRMREFVAGRSAFVLTEAARAGFTGTQRADQLWPGRVPQSGPRSR